jgi:hypothetical protein
MAKLGRPDKYEKKYCDMLIDHMSNGYSFQSFAGEISVTIKTLYNWCDTYPDFLHAMEIGRAKGLNYDEKLLTKGALGTLRGYNFNAHKWKMANMYRWSEKVEQTNIDITKEDTEKLKEEALQLLKELE